MNNRTSPTHSFGFAAEDNLTGEIKICLRARRLYGSTINPYHHQDHTTYISADTASVRKFQVQDAAGWLEKNKLPDAFGLDKDFISKGKLFVAFHVESGECVGSTNTESCDPCQPCSNGRGFFSRCRSLRRRQDSNEEYQHGACSNYLWGRQRPYCSARQDGGKARASRKHAPLYKGKKTAESATLKEGRAPLTVSTSKPKVSIL
jgi:hypothetical protein